jgi:hypothetical protein
MRRRLLQPRRRRRHRCRAHRGGILFGPEGADRRGIVGGTANLHGRRAVQSRQERDAEPLVRHGVHAGHTSGDEHPAQRMIDSERLHRPASPVERHAPARGEAQRIFGRYGYRKVGARDPAHGTGYGGSVAGADRTCRPSPTRGAAGILHDARRVSIGNKVASGQSTRTRDLSNGVPVARIWRMIQIILEHEPDHFGKQPVIAVDDLDELAMPVQALQGGA